MEIGKQFPLKETSDLTSLLGQDIATILYILHNQNGATLGIVLLSVKRLKWPLIKYVQWNRTLAKKEKRNIIKLKYIYNGIPTG